MEQGTSAADDAASPDQVKLCECGCGQPTRTAERDDLRYGYIKGQPRRFLQGHSRRGVGGFRGYAEEVPPAGDGLCECGSGQLAPIATVNDTALGYVKGRPKRFVRGHYARPKRTKFTAREGQRIGRSIVVDPEARFTGPNGNSLRALRLRCDCGNEYVRRTFAVFRNPDNESCKTCIIGADLTGQRFGRLTVIRWVPSRKGSSVRWRRKWLCMCDCGNEVLIPPVSLTKGSKRSCGCGRTGPQRGLAPGDAAFARVLHQYQKGAATRGLTWNLSSDDFRRLTALDCHYCGAAPGQVRTTAPSSGSYVYNGLDRMDNTRGYELDNVCPACRPCNFAKKDMPYEDWMAWIARLASYQFFKPDVTPVRPLA